MTNFWVIIAFLTIPHGSTGPASAWINYKDIYPTKVYCQTFLRTYEDTLSTRLVARLKEKRLGNITVDELVCLSSQEVTALDENQYLDLYKSAGMVI